MATRRLRARLRGWSRVAGGAAGAGVTGGDWRTRPALNPDSLFRHSAEGNLRIGPFLALLTAAGDDPARSGNGDDPARSGNGDDPARSGNGNDPARSGPEVEPSPG